MNTSDQSTEMASGVGKSPAHSANAPITLLPPTFTMRVGKRRLTMSWRARKPVPLLLTGLLHRSWRAMFGRGLRISMTAAAICAAWNVQALAAAPPVNTLPTGGIITSGSATITQNGNTLNINQSSNQAIGNFTTFSIGANATVDISQPSSAAAFLARVTGSDPSLIYGLLKSNGTVALINQNGIMVGPGGVVDVARFIASTLNISDSDFLAGRLTFNAGATAGNIDNQGTIKAATGGSVYLIGANVSNSGVIQSKNGEILLAAGQTVQLVDTATPGVSVNVTGSNGNVTNLGTITAEAGRIGIAAGLINNSGNINASSVVSEGGRIFLRASQNLTTTASSDISADGATKGGSVVLYSDKVAYIDGTVSATGAPGQGGFVETSGKTSLDVIKLPSIGSGGTWLIDPYDLEVVGAGGTATTNISGVITSIGSSAKVEAATITGMLDIGVGVTLTTGAGGAADGGNITVSSAINKTSGSAASLTLNANNSIAINADITNTSGGALNLNLNSNLSGLSGQHAATVSGAQILLNGGILAVSDNGGANNGTLLLNSGANVNLGNFGTLNAGTLNISSGGSLSGGHASSVNLQGTLTNRGTVNFQDAVISAGNQINNYGQFTTANVSVNAISGFTNQLGGVLNLNALSRLQGGIFTNFGTATAIGNGGLVTFESGVSNFGALNLQGSIMSNASGTNQIGAILNLGTDSLTTHLQGSGSWYNDGTLKVLGTGNIANIDNALSNSANAIIQIAGSSNTLSVGSLSTSGSVSVGASNTLNGNSGINSGNVSMNGGALSFINFTNAVGGNLSGTGTITANGQFTNSGVMSPGGDGSIGQLAINGNFTQTATGVLNIDVASATSYDSLHLNAPNTVQLGGTLQSKLLGGYVPTLNTVVAPIVMSNYDSGSTYFRNVLGDVVVSGGVKQMLKAGVINNTISLTMSAGADIAFTGSSGSDWGSASAWSTGYIPTAVDRVSLGGGTVVHSSGIDTVDQLRMLSADTLSLTGGSLTTTSMANNGTLSIAGGNFTTTTMTGNGIINLSSGNLGILGAARLNQLSVNGGTVTGGVGSSLNVAESFQQTAGTLTLADAAFNVATGDMAVGNITANNLVLESENGALTQNTSTALHVKQQLITSTATGTTLSNSANQIAAFAANNRLSGDITLVNTINLTDTAAVALNGISNTGGNVSVVNTGAALTRAIGSNADFLAGIPTAIPSSSAAKLALLGIDTSGGVKSTTGTVSVVTHSPLTIGIGGVNAAGNVVLTAGNNNSALDNLTINGVIASAGGNINLFAGNNMFVNANIATSAPGIALLTVVNGVITYAPGVSVTDASGTRIPVAALIAALTPTVLTPAVTSAIASPSTVVVNQVNITPEHVNNPMPSALPVNTPAPAVTQVMTTGGEAGSFGGEDSSSGANTQGDAKKPLKLYCS